MKIKKKITDFRTRLISLTGISTASSGDLETLFLGKGFILILRSSMMVSPFSSANLQEVLTKQLAPHVYPGESKVEAAYMKQHAW
jgi:hypothetical protein